LARSRKPQHIGGLIGQFLTEKGLDSKIEESQIIETWASMAGVEINSVTRSVYIKENRLIVQITSASARQDLFTRRKELLDELNKRVGNERIKAIAFR